MKCEASTYIHAQEEILKIKGLRAEKQVGRFPPRWSAGSRKIKGFIDVRDNNSGALQGALFLTTSDLK